jgi:hypothetical protein
MELRTLLSQALSERYCVADSIRVTLTSAVTEVLLVVTH